MFKNLISDPLVSNIIRLSEELDDSNLFHSESHESMKLMSELEFISKVFEANLMEEDFLLKKWADYEIPHLKIFQDNIIDLKYHIFSPCSSGKIENASYLIHHHGNNILSSFVFYGSGYNSIHFDKKILKNKEGNFNLIVDKKISHIKGNFSIVPSWVPHFVSNVESTSATVVLWSEEKTPKTNSSSTNEIRMNYFYENGKFYGINEEEFTTEINKISNFEIDSEKHIQAICYLMQEIGYVNNIFLKNIINNHITPKKWVKHLILLLENRIEAPIFNMKINTLNKEIKIKLINKYY